MLKKTALESVVTHHTCARHTCTRHAKSGPIDAQNLRTGRVAQLMLTALLVLLSPAIAWGQTVLIDLGDNFSDMSMQNWNTVVFNQAYNDLVDDTGAMTGISFTPFFWGGDFQNSANWIEDTDWVLKDAATDHFGGFFDSRIIFGNLDGVYKLEVVCAHPQTNHLTDITVNDQFANANFQNISGVDGDDFDPKDDGRDAQNFLIWENIMPVSGNITLRVTKLAGTNAISVGALRLTRTGDAQSGSISVTATPDSNEVNEPSQGVEIDVRVSNTGDGSVDITSLTDTVAGNLDGQGDCSMPQSIAEGGAYECTFFNTVSGNAGNSFMSEASASGSGVSGSLNESSLYSIDILDVLPSAAVSKATICQETIASPGEEVVMNVRIDNTSPESIDLTDLFDDQHGDLNGQGDCSVPQTIGAGSSYACSYLVNITGLAGESETSTLTATFEDDEMNIETATGSVTISIQDIGNFVFRDCFESGDLTGWSEIVPGT